MARYAPSDPCRTDARPSGRPLPLTTAVFLVAAWTLTTRRPQMTRRRPARARRALSGVHTGALGVRGRGRRPGTRRRPRSSFSFRTTAPEVRPRRSIRRGQRLHRRRVADRGRTPSLPSYAPNLHQRHERSASPRSQRGTAASAWAWSRYTCRAQVTASRPDRRGATSGDRRSTRRGRRQRALRSRVGSSIGPSFRI